MYITAHGCRLQNDLYCVEWDVKPYYAYHTPMEYAESAVKHQYSGYMLLINYIDVLKFLFLQFL